MTTSDNATAETTLMATSSDYRLALLAIRDARTTKPAAWDLWVNLLKTHYAMPGHVASPTQLAAATRLSSTGAASLNYGKLAHAIADQLGYCPPERQYGKRDPMWWMAVSSGTSADEREENFQLTMHAELAEALELMRWVQPQASAT